jgi:hypothetical protein
MKEDERHIRGNGKKRIKFWLGNLKGRDHFGDLVVVQRVIKRM